MKHGPVILCALLAAAPASATAGTAQGGIATCVETAGEVETCLGHTYNACLATLPPPKENGPIFPWKENDRLCCGTETAEWDGRPIEAYRDLISGIGETFPDAPEELRSAQRAWIAFRDAECSWPSAFLRQNDLHNIEVSCMAKLMAERVARLARLKVFA